jgi:hypothetical protein
MFVKFAILSSLSTAPTDVTFDPQAGVLRYASPSLPLAETAKSPWETAKLYSLATGFESQ